MKTLSILMAIVAFLLCRPYVLGTTGMLYAGDDDAYFAHSTAIAFLKYPNYKNEYWRWSEGYPQHPAGAGVMAAPFVLAFSMIDRITGNSIVARRTPDNIPQSWSLFGFVVASNVFFWLGCSLLYLAVRRFAAEKDALLGVALMILAQGIPLYVYRRPGFAHVHEFFLQSLMIWCLCCELDGSRWTRERPQLFLGLISITTALIAITRPNNAFYALLWPTIIFWNRLKQARFAFRKCLALLGIPFVTLITFYMLFNKLPAYYSGVVSKYDSMSFAVVADWISFDFYLKRLLYIFFYWDWGLIFTAPLALLAFWGVRDLKKERGAVICLLLLGLVNLFVVCNWRTQGSWYGYRYLVISWLPVAALPFTKVTQKTPPWMLLLLSIPPFLSMLAFEGNATHLTLYTNRAEGAGWRNDTYQLEVWKTLFTRPLEFASAALKGGPLYLVYLAAEALGLRSRLPEIVQSKYPQFQWILLLRTLILWTLPGWLYLAYARLTPARSARNG